MEKIPIRHIYETSKGSDSFGSFRIRSIQELLNREDRAEHLHRHDFFTVLLLKKGVGYNEIDFVSFEVCDYSVFLMRPGQVHQLSLKAETTGYLMQFETEFFYSQSTSSQQLLRKISQQNFCQLDIDSFKKLDSILAFILEEYNNKQEGYQEAIKSSLSIFFIELVRHRQNKNVSSKSSYIQEQLEKFLTLLEVNITKYKQVSHYADLLHISTYQLNTVTKTSLNKAPSDLINESIILEAKRQLLATTNQVNQIADYLGYDDVSYFIRFFKKHTGSSPEAFRNNSR